MILRQERDYLVIALLMAVVALYLNFQNVIFQLALFDKYVLSLWMLVPSVLLLRYCPVLILRMHQDLFSLFAILFLFILIIHSIFQLYFHGIYGALYSFVAYGLWMGLFAWCLLSNWRIVLMLAATIFIFSALLHSSIVTYEYFSGNYLLKISNIGIINRYYGISTSLSIMGLQISVGILALLHLLVSTKTNYLRPVIITLITFMLVSLLISSSRGPLIYLIISLLPVLILYIVYRKQRARIIKLTAMSIVIGAVCASMYYYNASNADFILQALTTSDESNQVRLSIYSKSVGLFFSNGWVPVVGYGSGSMTLIAEHFSGGELTLESSFIKAILELGIIGMLPFLLSLLTLLYLLIRKWSSQLVQDNIIYFSILFLILMQCATHETFKTWIGSLYLTLSFGVCVSILRDKSIRQTRS